jgi:hypothetical protein
MNVRQRFKGMRGMAGPLVFGGQILNLSCNHSGRSRPSGQLTATSGSGVRRHLFSDDLKRVCQEGVPRKNRHRFAEFPVASGLSATKIVVVHRRQIVMYQRIRVYHFGGRCGRQRTLVLTTTSFGRKDHQYRP